MSLKEDFAADKAEMDTLLSACKSERVANALRTWDPAGDVKTDLQEMETLLAGCTRSGVRTKLMPWLDQQRQRLGIILPDSGHDETIVPASSSTAPLAKTHDAQSKVICAGAASLCQRRLVEVLSGATEGSLPVEHEGLLETKYYSARLLYQAIDLSSDSKSDFSSAEALIALWDPSKAASFELIKDAVGPGRPAHEEGEELEHYNDDEETLRLCVALAPSDASFDDLEAEAMGWCVEHGFEFLRCPATDEDFALLRARVEQSVGGMSTGILEQDTDGTLLRVREALECQQWSNLQRRTAQNSNSTPNPSSNSHSKSNLNSNSNSTAPKVASAESRPHEDASESPEVLIVGRGDEPGSLLSAISGKTSSSSSSPESGKKTEDRSKSVEEEGCQYHSAEGTLRTKYYTADLKFTSATLEQEATASPYLTKCLEAASAILLVVPAGSDNALEQMTQICDAFISSAENTESAEEDHNNDAEKDGKNSTSKLPLRSASRPIGKIKLLIAALTEGQQPSDVWVSKAQSWALEKGFEYLSCKLDSKSLEAFGRGVEGGHRLLDESSQCSSARIVEALQCHAWPNMKLVKRNDPAASIAKEAEDEQHRQAKEVAKVDKFDPPKRLDETTNKTAESAVEAIDHFAAEIKSVRNTTDEAERRARACDVAMRLAEALGVDESDSD